MGTHKLLLADDNSRSLKLLKAIYEAEGYDVAIASDGKEAMTILYSDKIDVIVTDVLMPNVDGYYLCYKVRSNDRLRDIPIIIYTATYTSQSEEKIAMEMGADRFIRKPAAMQVLVSAVKEVLANPVKHAPISKDPDSFEIMHQYSSELINKLEQRNLELEQATDSLELTLKRFKQAEQIAHLGHWEIDFATKKTTWSDETFCMFGMEPGTVDPSENLFLQHVHPEDSERVRTEWHNSLQMLAPFSFYHRILQADGEVRNFFTMGRYEFDKSGKPLRLYGISLDITVMTENEQKLIRANKELETFIYKAYHDLRSPIVSILGIVHLAKLEIADPLASGYFTSIGDIAQRQNKMLLNLVKAMSIRDMQPTSEPILIDELLGEVLRSLESTQGFGEITFTLCNEITDTIFTNRQLLSDVLLNLIENSIHFRRSDNITPKTTINIFRDGRDHVSIEIADDGIGIPEEVHNKIFDMFFRATSISRGSGLGLYLVKTAAEKLGGTIEVSSTEGTGSKFKLKIPVRFGKQAS